MKHDFPDKILFLDVDGVVNTHPYLYFNSQCLLHLEYIIKETSCKIVVSSSWKEEDLVRMSRTFNEWGMSTLITDHIIDITVRGYHYVIKGSKLPIVRGNEIKLWVDTHLKYPWHADTDCNGFYELKNSKW